MDNTEARLAVLFAAYDDVNASNDEILEILFSTVQHCQEAASVELRQYRFDVAFDHLRKAEEALDEANTDRKVLAGCERPDIVAVVRAMRHRSLVLIRQFEERRTGKSAAAARPKSGASTSRGGTPGTVRHSLGSGPVVLPPTKPAEERQKALPSYARPRAAAAGTGTRIGSEENIEGNWRAGLRGDAPPPRYPKSTNPVALEDDLASNEGDPVMAVRREDDDTPLSGAEGADTNARNSLRRVEEEIALAREQYLKRQSRENPTSPPRPRRDSGSPVGRRSGSDTESPPRSAAEEIDDTLRRAAKAQRESQAVVRHMQDRAAKMAEARAKRLREEELRVASHLLDAKKEVDAQRGQAAMRRKNAEEQLSQLRLRAEAREEERREKARNRLAAQRPPRQAVAPSALVANIVQAATAYELHDEHPPATVHSGPDTLPHTSPSQASPSAQVVTPSAVHRPHEEAVPDRERHIEAAAVAGEKNTTTSARGGAQYQLGAAAQLITAAGAELRSKAPLDPALVHLVQLCRSGAPVVGSIGSPDDRDEPATEEEDRVAGETREGSPVDHVAVATALITQLPPRKQSSFAATPTALPPSTPSSRKSSFVSSPGRHKSMSMERGVPLLPDRALDLKQLLAVVRIQRVVRGHLARQQTRTRKAKLHHHITFVVPRTYAHQIIVRAWKQYAARLKVRAMKDRASYMTEQRVEIEKRAVLDFVPLGRTVSEFNMSMGEGACSPILASTRSELFMSLRAKKRSVVGSLKPTFVNRCKKGTQEWHVLNSIQRNMAARRIQRNWREYLEWQLLREQQEAFGFLMFATGKTVRLPSDEETKQMLEFNVRPEDEQPGSFASMMRSGTSNNASATSVLIPRVEETGEDSPVLEESVASASSPAVRQTLLSPPSAILTEGSSKPSLSASARGADHSGAQLPAVVRPDLPYRSLRHVKLSEIEAERREREDVCRAQLQAMEDAMQTELERKRMERLRTVESAICIQKMCRGYRVRLRLAALFIDQPSLSSSRGSPSQMSGMPSSSGFDGEDLSAVPMNVHLTLLELIESRNPQLLPERRQEYANRRNVAAARCQAILRALISSRVARRLLEDEAARRIQHAWCTKERQRAEAEKAVRERRVLASKPLIPRAL